MAKIQAKEIRKYGKGSDHANDAVKQAQVDRNTG